MGEAALWLDRIQEAYETEVRYDHGRERWCL
jgi:hypothetical protein